MSGVRSFLKGEGLFTPLSQIQEKELVPLARDLRDLIRDLEEETAPSEEPRIRWTAETLKRNKAMTFDL